VNEATHRFDSAEGVSCFNYHYLRVTALVHRDSRGALYVAPPVGPYVALYVVLYVALYVAPLVGPDPDGTYILARRWGQHGAALGAPSRGRPDPQPVPRRGRDLWIR
jgi:hypothetical protein